jgi:hypothetical protein
MTSFGIKGRLCLPLSARDLGVAIIMISTPLIVTLYVMVVLVMLVMLVYELDKHAATDPSSESNSS